MKLSSAVFSFLLTIVQILPLFSQGSEYIIENKVDTEHWGSPVALGEDIAFVAGERSPEIYIYTYNNNVCGT